MRGEGVQMGEKKNEEGDQNVKGKMGKKVWRDRKELKRAERVRDHTVSLEIKK